MIYIFVSILFIVFIFSLVSSANFRGSVIEFIAKRKILKKNSLIIDNINYNQLIDTIIIDKTGVYLIKYINSEGEFFGNDKKGNWIMIKKARKSQIKNPVKLNDEAVLKIKNEYKVDCKGIILFNLGSLKGVESKVCYKTKDILKAFDEDIKYSDDELKNLYEILNKIPKIDKKTKR